MSRDKDPMSSWQPLFSALAIDPFTVIKLRCVLLSARYPAGEELVWVGGAIRSWDAALVEVTLDDGTTGLGEAGAGIMAAAAVPGIIEAYRPHIEGRAFGDPLHVADVLRAYTAFWSRGGISSGVAGAIESACLDAVAKREGVPAYELLGGLKRSRIEAYASGGLGTSFDQIAAWMHAQVDAGYRTVKFRAMDDPATTIGLLRHVVPMIPSDVQFILDAVQGCASSPWSVSDAIEVGRQAARLGARWYEEPCQADDVSGYVEVRSTLDVRVSGIESSGRVSEFTDLMERGAIDIAQPDVSFVGGHAAFRRVAQEAHARRIPCVPHVWGSGVTFMANLHSSLSEANVELFESCTLPNPLRDALLTEHITMIDGQIHAPLGAGLGVALTPEVEAQFPFFAGGGHVIR